MRAVLGFTLLAIVCVGGAWVVSGLPGSISATIAGTTIETTTPVALALLAVLFLLIYLVVRLLAWLIRLPRAARRWRAERLRRNGDMAVTRTLVALAANDAGAARREAERSRRLLGATPLTLLLTAQAGRQAGRDAEAEEAFRRLAESEDGKLLGLRGLLRAAMQKQDWETAAALAREAEQVHPGAAWLREERRQMAMRTGHWSEALRLSREGEGRTALSIAAAAAEPDANTALKLARRAFEAEPTLAPAAIAYATRLRDAGRESKALEALRESWAASPHPDVAEAYLRHTADPEARLQEAARLVRNNAAHPESELLLARELLAAGAPGQARTHLNRAMSAGLTQRRTWQVLADIEMADGQPEAAQEALRRMATAEPDPTWRCTNCSTAHAAWHPSCDACGAVGTIAWAQPATQVTARLPAPREVEGLVSE